MIIQRNDAYNSVKITLQDQREISRMLDILRYAKYNTGIGFGFSAFGREEESKEVERLATQIIEGIEDT